MASNQEVYTGVWTNHAQSSIAGTTLTLTSSHGAYLIAFLALFIHVVGVGFWRLICYGVFQFRAHLNLHISVKLQEQLVLRNSPSAISGMRNFMFMTVRSRREARISTLALLCIATVNFSAFLAAGILSSEVTATRPDVLLRPTNCGRWWAYSNYSRGGIAYYPNDNERFAQGYGVKSDLRQTSSQYVS